MLLTDIAARCYTAGPAPADALKVSKEFDRQGIPTVIGYWNDNGDSPEIVWNACARILDGLQGCSTPAAENYLSVKLPALGFSDSLLHRLLDKALRRNVSIHFDALSHPDAGRIGDVLHRMVRRYTSRGLGLTIPGRWRRSLFDAEWAARTGVRIRVVKGEWPDPESPETDLRYGFLDVIDRLSGRSAVVSIATHDTELADEAARRLKKGGTPFEFELLFGRPLSPIMDLARGMRIPVRVYVPCGRAWLPYRLKTIPQSPRISGWFMRDIVKGAAKALLSGTGHLTRDT